MTVASSTVAAAKAARLFTALQRTHAAPSHPPWPTTARHHAHRGTTHAPLDTTGVAALWRADVRHLATTTTTTANTAAAGTPASLTAAAATTTPVPPSPASLQARPVTSSSSSSPVHTSNLHTSTDLSSSAPPPPPPPHSGASTLEDTMCPDLPLVFDTHKLVSYLQHSGLSPRESEAITSAMVRISQHASRHNINSMVTKSEFSALRSELSILEKADFALLKTDIHAIEKRLDTSVAEIYTAVEKVENRVIKWVIAVAGAIGLGIIRLMSTSGSSGGGSGGGGGGSGGGVFVPRPPTANINHQVDYNRNAGGGDVEESTVYQQQQQQQQQQRRQDDGQLAQQQQQPQQHMHAQMSHDVRQCGFDGHLPNTVARRRCRSRVDMVHT